MTLKECPRCGGDLFPHCSPNRRHRTFSHACDIVECANCGQLGMLDGRYFDRPQRRYRQSWARLLRTIESLRVDVGEDTP